MMHRRDFIGGMGVGLVVARSGAWAQPAAGRFTVGVLSGTTPAIAGPLVDAFEAALRELGYVEGRNITFERRWAYGMPDRLPALASELVRLRVDVILASIGSVIEAARGATATIPIVMALGGEFAGKGWIASLARPGGNLTGLSYTAITENWGKRLQLLKEIVPGLSRVAFIAERSDLTPQTSADARTLGLTLDGFEIESVDDVDKALAWLASSRARALLVGGSIRTYMRREQIAAFAIEHRLPAVSAPKEYAQAGLLLSYGANQAELYRRAAGYVDKILRGAKPGDLPIELPTRFDLAINLKTAKALGLTIPQSLLLRADEVIE